MSARFQKWHHRSEIDEVVPVFPDGCRDVLIIQRPGERDQVTLTELDFVPRTEMLPNGTEITGYRLYPGAAIGRCVLDAIALNSADTENILGDALEASDDLNEVIAALAVPGSTLLSVSRSYGVSVRTLQRRFRGLQLPAPEYWRLLGRARWAVRLLSSPIPLAEIAVGSGFSDQAHMTRELVRWFGLPPTRLRRDAGLLGLLGQPALGNWTGEQISTR